MTTTATNENVEIKFKDDFQALETKLTPLLSADATTGIIALPADAFFANAPEGMTESTYERHHKYVDLFNNVATKIGSEQAVKLMAENKELQTVTMTAPVYKKDSFEGVFKRTGTKRNVQTGEVTNYVGSIGVGRINVVSTRTKAEWSSIKQNMTMMAEAAGL